jgi:hypothetical protein
VVDITRGCWGIGQKHFTLETSDLPKSWVCSWISRRVEISVWWQVNIHILMNYIHFTNLLTICQSNSRIGFSSRVCYLFQDKDNWELAKFTRPGTREVRMFGGAFVQKL